MTRILTYNILVGGTRRIEQITNMIQSAQPDVVGLVEATDPRVVEELAERLGMDYRMSGYAKYVQDMEIAVLSRLPIVHTHTYRRPGILGQPMLEVGVQEEDGRELTIFVTHLTAAPHVRNVRTSLVLHNSKYEAAVPLEVKVAG